MAPAEVNGPGAQEPARSYNEQWGQWDPAEPTSDTTRLPKAVPLKVAVYYCLGINEINKREAIKQWATDNDVDVMLLTETKLKGQAKEGSNATDYTTYFASREKDWTYARGGRKHEQAGVAMMIKSSLTSSVTELGQ